MNSGKMLKIHLLGRISSVGQIDPDHRDTILINVDMAKEDLRKAVMDATFYRVSWLNFVANDQMRVYWIGK